jgi:hypothetical protein
MFKNKPAMVAFLLSAGITILLFIPSLRGEFIIVDDSIYVVTNPLIRNLDWATVVDSFAAAHYGWWMPLTWLSFALDYRIWGLDPFGYHLHNIVLHGINTGLVVLIADRLCRPLLPDPVPQGRSDAVYTLFLVGTALLFGIHPLRVESVAWVAERKDVLNGLCAFGAILLYLSFVRARSDGRQGVASFVGAFVLFACSLMAKGASVGLPFVLLVLDWYPLGRTGREPLGRLLLEKVPFMALAVASAAATVYFVRENAALISFEAFPFSQRLIVSGNSLWEYWRLFFLPLGLTPLHVIPDPIPPAYILKALAVGALLVGIFASTRQTWLKATLLCYIFPLFPVLGFFQNGDQAYAARFTYLAALAQTIATAFLLFRLYHQGGAVRRRLVAVGALALLAGATLVSQTLIPQWRSTESYWTSIIAREPLAINYKERGRHFFTTGRYDAAVADFSAALERLTVTLEPYAYNLYGYRAEANRMAGRPAEAVADFTRAIASLPQPAYFHHRGLALQALGRTTEATADFLRAGPNPGPISWYD